MKDSFYRRIKQFFMATLGLISLTFVACLPLYPYFRLPLHPNLVLGTMLIVLILGIVSILLSLVLKRRIFPTQIEKATRRYFWLYALVSTPFLFSLLIYIVFAPLSLLILGYFLTLFGLILLKPKEEDLV
ncbi:hypothetical protein [Thermocrinis sp.]